MEHCNLCRKPFIPDSMGLNPVMLSFFENDKINDAFKVHERCADEFIAKRDHFKSDYRARRFIKQTLAKMSM